MKTKEKSKTGLFTRAEMIAHNYHATQWNRCGGRFAVGLFSEDEISLAQ